MKNVRQYLQECFEAERPKFVRVLKAVPADQAAYRPHPRSTCTGDLVWLLAFELHDACNLIDHGEATYAPQPAPPVQDAVAAYEKNAAGFAERLARIDDAAWEKPARFLVDGKAVWEAPLGAMRFGFLFYAIH